MNNFKIYALKDPSTQQIRYIGYTDKSLDERLKQHINERKHNTHRGHWINTLFENDQKPIIEVVEDNLSAVCIGAGKTAGGFIWKYHTENNG